MFPYIIKNYNRNWNTLSSLGFADKKAQYTEYDNLLPLGQKHTASFMLREQRGIPLVNAKLVSSAATLICVCKFSKSCTYIAVNLK